MLDAPYVSVKLLFAILAFITGLCVGSFLNVCIYRIPREISIIFPPSECPNCRKKIKVTDLIPVISYMILRGKCRKCKNPISILYPVVELITGLLWLLAFLKFGFTFETVAAIFLITLLIPVAFIDLEFMIIPNGLVITGLIGGTGVFLFHALYRPVIFFDLPLWYAPLIGMISASGILFIFALVTYFIYKNDGGMGMGDVKIFLPIGLILGARLALLSLFISFMIAGVLSAILLILKKLNRKSAIPFGPFIVIATILIIFTGPDLMFIY
ncbi:MAG: prepilin peptidase [Clostridiaceae bacterium]|nr:prepilin peptidase [Clostridiaceae bacterium]